MEEGCGLLDFLGGIVRVCPLHVLGWRGCVCDPNQALPLSSALLWAELQARHTPSLEGSQSL